MSEHENRLVERLAMHEPQDMDEISPSTVSIRASSLSESESLIFIQLLVFQLLQLLPQTLNQKKGTKEGQ